MTDQEALKEWYSEDYAKIIWEEFNGDQIVEHTWLEACRYKQKENTDLVMKLQTRIESLVAENAKLFEEAKRELAYKDKKIAYLEAECERVYHPIREFWNQEKDEEMKKLREEVERFRQALYDISQSTYEANPWTIVPSKEAKMARKALEEIELEEK